MFFLIGCRNPFLVSVQRLIPHATHQRGGRIIVEGAKQAPQPTAAA